MTGYQQPPDSAQPPECWLFGIHTYMCRTYMLVIWDTYLYTHILALGREDEIPRDGWMDK